MVLAIAAPFVYISYRLCDSMGDFTGTGGAHTFSRATSFIQFLWTELTPVPFVLAIVGAAAAVRRGWTWPPVLRTIAPASLVAVAIGGVVFHPILPREWYSGRYVAVSISPLL